MGKIRWNVKGNVKTKLIAEPVYVRDLNIVIKLKFQVQKDCGKTEDDKIIKQKTWGIETSCIVPLGRSYGNMNKALGSGIM